MGIKVILTSAGKRFNKEWIFKNVNFTFLPGEKYAVLGANGSGKSTLLQAIAGYYQLSAGTVQLEHAGSMLPGDLHYTQVALTSPSLELIEEFTLREFLQFHFSLKNYLPGCTYNEIITQTGLQKAEHRQIKFFSSGMKQRVKLAIALFSDAKIVLLDEPCTNLDVAGIQWYRSIVEKYTPGRLLIVASNQETEYDFCPHQVQMSSFK